MRAISVLVLLLLASPCAAAVWYVNPNIGAAADAAGNDGSQSQPFLSIGYAVSRASGTAGAHDTVYVYAFSSYYDASVTLASGKYIDFVGIDSGGSKPKWIVNASQRILYNGVSPVNNFVVDNFKFYGGASGSQLIDYRTGTSGNENTVRNCDFSGIYLPSATYTLYIQGASGGQTTTTICDCTFTNVQRIMFSNNTATGDDKFIWKMYGTEIDGCSIVCAPAYGSANSYTDTVLEMHDCTTDNVGILSASLVISGSHTCNVALWITDTSGVTTLTSANPDYAYPAATTYFYIFEQFVPPTPEPTGYVYRHTTMVERFRQLLYRR